MARNGSCPSTVLCTNIPQDDHLLLLGPGGKARESRAAEKKKKNKRVTRRTGRGKDRPHYNGAHCPGMWRAVWVGSDGIIRMRARLRVRGVFENGVARCLFCLFWSKDRWRTHLFALKGHLWSGHDRTPVFAGGEHDRAAHRPSHGAGALFHREPQRIDGIDLTYSRA